MAKRLGRQKMQLPISYYEGYLEIKYLKEQAPRRLWTSLCGDALFFFNNSKENQYVEKLELGGFISISDYSSPDRNLNTAGLLIHTKDDDVRLMAPSLETRELWKGFILSVKELSVPTSLNLLPGQVLMMREVVEREMDRRSSLPSSAPTPTPAPPPTTTTTTKCIVKGSSPLYLSVVSEMPACYEAVSRTEAEILLERHPDKGNLLLRPGRDGSSFAITTRQNLNGPVFRHYRVTRKHDSGFYIDVEKPIYCATLQGIVDCLVEKTAGTLQPLILDEPYEESITFVQANQENGEWSQRSVSPLPKPPSRPERKHSLVREEELEEELEENTYLNINDEDEKNEEAPVPPQPLPRRPMLRQQAASGLLPHQSSLPNLTGNRGPGKKALKPPKALPVPSSRGFHRADAPLNKLHNLALTSELQQKLVQRRAKE
ncbi:signal-transducing adaptor protein 2b isoform X2 [Clupea harengus]|uniref:Signal-transducing adaptor protein 2b isoform X2 n=1 Tax=Clupea harengus TaxID=7950 RepID=A0A6P8G501_CLUHA|nr:signal-transducing adaptor protein 2b isoform X2 [Clupea harengus]